jgi:protein TonB
MMNDKLLRLLVFIFAAALHLIVIFFLVLKTEVVMGEGPENARIMKVTDLDELPPPPEPEELPQVEAIAENMIETDTPPEQNVLAAGIFLTTNDYLPMHKLSSPPKFDASKIAADLVYPPIALRSGIEGRVILELFVDRSGMVQQISILQENPEDRGFGEAAVKAFTGRKGEPATANGEAVSARYRYPVTFKIK